MTTHNSHRTCLVSAFSATPSLAAHGHVFLSTLRAVFLCVTLLMILNRSLEIETAHLLFTPLVETPLKTACLFLLPWALTVLRGKVRHDAMPCETNKAEP